MNKAVQKIFAEVPATYELVNRILTTGFDVIWRKKAAKVGAAKGGSRWLDVCTGTGEMAVNLRKLASPSTTVFAVDFCLPMLGQLIKKKEARDIIMALADVEHLPFADNSFDLITISFATRNINYCRKSLDRCLNEFFRILKPGGRFVNVETSQPTNKIINRLFRLYIDLFVSPVGRMISGSKKGYAYLSKTIPRFYGADEFSDIIKSAGFARVTYNRMLSGVAAIHEAVK
jgi:demethylmenaquinone methyltransferase/2-methoxy-6-polyprenyl-1,4-benzoquinol methylase